jgi:hypothetical protein
MNPIERFARYATAFETAVDTDDWSAVEPYFTEDAEYETLGEPPFNQRSQGRKNVMEHLKRSLDSFDRRFDVRENPEMLEGPELRDGAVWFRWRVTYRVADAPPFPFEGEETAHFEGDRIRRLEDRFAPDTGARLATWMAEHGSKLKPPPAGAA